MSREELEENLGVIANSGTFRFRQELDPEKAGDTDVIGQFGVGLYSAFMVADHITVISKKYGEEQAYRWESSGADGYTVDPCEKGDGRHGYHSSTCATTATSRMNTASTSARGRWRAL